MLNQNQDIFNKALSWITQGHKVVLYTVVKTWGSSPRPPGSVMILRDDGRVAGSVSGGCIEDDLIRRVREQGIADKPEIISYGVKTDEARRFGLPCGGTMRLVQESLNGLNAFESLKGTLEMLGRGEIVCRTLDLSTGNSVLRNAKASDVLLCNESEFTRVLGPRYRLLIIGAGQIGELLAKIALSLDFSVTVCDPREEYSAEWSIEETNLVTSMPDDTVLAMKIDSRTAVVALTHDPKLDDLALMEALSSPAFYIGALGSRLNNDKRRDRLLEFDLNAEQVACLRGPVGVEIGSHTPAEIAVSIAAEIIAVKNKVQ